MGFEHAERIRESVALLADELRLPDEDVELLRDAAPPCFGLRADARGVGFASVGAIDISSELGARAEQRLRSERTIWLATVALDGAPDVRPVWFLWDGASFLLFSKPTAAKLRAIAANPDVCLHLDPDEWGENVVIVTGKARIAPERPRADETPAFVEKYSWGFERFRFTASEYADEYSTPVSIVFESLRTYY